MAGQMRLTDETRLNILEALLRKGSVQPNLNQIKRHTGYHLATIKSSLDFLKKQGLLEGYGPKMNFRSLGYKLESIVLLQADLSEEKTFRKFLEAVEKDPNLYRLSSIIGSGTWNLVARYIHRDVESFHKREQEEYFEKIHGIYNLVKDRDIFYTTEPHYKNESRTKSIIEIIKREKGLI